MSKTAKIIAGLVVVIIVLLIISGGKKGETGPIKIGFVGPLTGDAAALGKSSQAAVQVAIEEINTNGGINGRMLEGIYEDGKCTPAPALSAVQKMITLDKVDVIIGGLCSGETSAFIKVAMEAKIPTVTYCSSAPTLTGSGKYFFRTYPSDSFQGKFAAEYAYNTLKAKNVSIIYHNNDWGNGIEKVFVERFKELGGNITGEEPANKDARDYKTILSKIKGQKPDLIYAPTYPEGGAIIVKQIKELEIKTPILGSETFDDPSFLKAIPKSSQLNFTISKPNVSPDFDKKILAKLGGEQVPVCGPQAYDAATVLVKAMKEVGTDPDKMADFIHKLDFEGVSGHIKYDNNGDLSTASYGVKKVENNTATLITN
jgi:branched-chain amino acid transport system substrate-binding protein